MISIKSNHKELINHAALRMIIIRSIFQCGVPAKNNPIQNRVLYLEHQVKEKVL